MMPAAAPSRATPAPSRFADACYLALRVTGWLAVTSACVAALWLLLFVMLGNFSFAGTVLQIENVASRYVAADGARQDRFRLLFWLASAGLFVLVAFLRRHSLGRVAANIPHSKETPHGR
jgi:hypothetical protein